MNHGANVEEAIARRRQILVVKLQRKVGVVVLVHRSPTRIVTVAKTAPCLVELVTEHQTEQLSVRVAVRRQTRQWSVSVHPSALEVTN